MRLLPLLSFLCIISTFSVAQAEAETVYVVDKISAVRLRTGPGTNFDVAHPGVGTGEVLSLTGQQRNGWSQVRFGTTTGWIMDIYIQEEPIYQMRYDALVTAHEQAMTELSQLQALGPIDSDTLVRLQEELQQQLHARETSEMELERVLSLSSNAVDLDNRNQQLIQSNRNLENRLQQIEAENLVLRENQMTRQWLIGGLLVAIGAILSGLLRFLRPRNRSHDTWV